MAGTIVGMHHRPVKTRTGATPTLVSGRAANTHRKRYRTTASKVACNTTTRVSSKQGRSDQGRESDTQHQRGPASSVKQDPITAPKLSFSNPFPITDNTPHRIRMIHEYIPLDDKIKTVEPRIERKKSNVQGGTTASQPRPVNNYKGKDSAMRTVSNPKLRAILKGMPVRERRAKTGFQLRMGARGGGASV